VGRRGAQATLRPARAVAILLRTTHLGAMALLVGGAWYGLPPDALRGAGEVTVLSGAGLVVSEASHGRHWPYQVRGLLVLAHLALAALVSQLGPGALLAAVVVGAVGSHLPKGLRAWSLRHRAVLDEDGRPVPPQGASEPPSQDCDSPPGPRHRL